MPSGEDKGLSIPDVELLEELGRGGSSIVYRAVRRGEPCAVKVARSIGRDARWFRREAAILARVRHRGIPSVLEVGDVEGLPYLIMELVEGETLADRLSVDRRPLGEPLTLDIAIGLLDILDAIHQRGLVHRDISPRNIVLEADGSVRLVDFGFATFNHTPPDGAGTRAYTAPEQLRVPVLVDARTDLYSLGAVLLECLTGSPMRPGVPLDETDVTPALTAVLRGLLASDPARRYPCARDAAADFARVAAGDTPAGPAGVARPAEPLPFVGRERERDQLVQAWQGARAGAGQGVLLLGSAGSGKSRLVREAVAALDATGGEVLDIRCAEGDPRPFAAVRRLLDRLAIRLHEDPARDERVASIVSGAAPLLATLCPALLERTGDEDPQEAPSLDAETVGQVTAELLERIASAVDGLAIWIDDAQWLDPASTGVFVRLLHRAPEAPLLLVLAAREDPFSAAQLPGETERITLSPFAADAMASYVRGYLGTEAPVGLLEWLTSVTDGTPLDAAEVLDAMLDAGALAPRDGDWDFDRERAEGMELPRGALALLARRLEELAPATRRVFEMAAVIGASWEDTLLAEVAGTTVGELGFALAEGRHARLVEPDANGHRFTHDSTRDAFLRGMDAQSRERAHLLVAEALDRRAGTNVYELALHYAAANAHESAPRTFAVGRAAALRALQDLDGEATLRFFEAARRAAMQAQCPIDADLLRAAGEAALRLGAHLESIGYFESALDLVRDPVARAALLGRIAWAHQARPDVDAAWRVLEQGFAALGEELPTERPATVVPTLAVWALSHTGKRRGDAGVRRNEVLCQLYYQAARLGNDYQRPLRLVQSTMRMRALAAGLTDPALLARTDALYGITLAIVGQRSAGWRYIETALDRASRAGRPELEVYCLQLSSVAALFCGDFDRALQLIRELLDSKGAWLDAHDFCLDAYNAHLVEVLRGRPREAWGWVERAINRVVPHGKAPSAFVMTSHCARATMAALHETVSDAEVRAKLGVRVDSEGPLQGFLRVGAWGSRARYLVESGQTGAEFDALVEEFRLEKINPRFAHPILVEYYIAVTEARVHRALRAPAAERARHVRLLGKAIRDLRAIARYPLFKAHLHLAEGWHAHLSGDNDRARKKLARAERFADQESAPGVLYGVARAHAHILRAEGRIEASRERARVALAIAREHGAVPRARWIQEELGGSWSTVDAARRSVIFTSGSTSRRQLRALLKLLRVCSGELDQKIQARLLLDELVETVPAARGLLSFAGERAGEPLVTARTRRRQDWEATLEARALVDEARSHGEARAKDIPVSAAEGRVIHAIAVPLFLNERVVGAVYLERDPGAPPFGDDETDVLVALSCQVPIALELARALKERETLEEGLRRAQRMEALGRFAGGIAHDFNNMLTAMEIALTGALRRDVDSEVTADLNVAKIAVHQGARLTEQLLRFARQERPAREDHDLNAMLQLLSAMIRRLIGPSIEVRTELRSSQPYAHLDAPLFEQAIVNLSLNARDAMHEGGVLSISTDDVVLDESTGKRPHGSSAGPHVLVRVRDTGTGMSREALANAFEPFFTTKGAGRGTGLGLSIVHGFIEQSEGAIELESELGKGTEFRLYFPRSAPPKKPRRAAPTDRPPPPPRASKPGHRQETILVVDDEELILRLLRRNLETDGYKVLWAKEGKAALELARNHGTDLDLLITDVTLPGMKGTDLAKAVADISPHAKLIFMSGYGAAELGFPETAFFIEKPFRADRLRGMVRELLGHTP